MTTSMFDLTGRTALVTGSTRGLGRAIAEGLAGAGARLVLNGTRPDKVDEAVAAFARHGWSASAAAFDVTDEKAVVAAFERLDAEGVAVDILVNNAGIQLRKPIVELTTAEFTRVLDVNLVSAFVVGREAARRMIARGGGKIVNIGSVTSDLARATITPYAVAKGGIRMLTRQMAVEWAASNIQVNAIGPGYMITDLNQALIDDPAFDAWVKGRTPARRWGSPEELVGAAVFLASRASDYVNGQMIFVDGGITTAL